MITLHLRPLCKTDGSDDRDVRRHVERNPRETLRGVACRVFHTHDVTFCSVKYEGVCVPLECSMEVLAAHEADATSVTLTYVVWETPSPRPSPPLLERDYDGVTERVAPRMYLSENEALRAWFSALCPPRIDVDGTTQLARIGKRLVVVDARGVAEYTTLRQWKDAFFGDARISVKRCECRVRYVTKEAVLMEGKGLAWVQKQPPRRRALPVDESKTSPSCFKKRMSDDACTTDVRLKRNR